MYCKVENFNLAKLCLFLFFFLSIWKTPVIQALAFIKDARNKNQKITLFLHFKFKKDDP